MNQVRQGVRPRETSAVGLVGRLLTNRDRPSWMPLFSQCNATSVIRYGGPSRWTAVMRSLVGRPLTEPCLKADERMSHQVNLAVWLMTWGNIIFDFM